MQEQIKKYIAENSGAASSVELALCFLKIKIDQESVARQLVTPLMEKDLFSYDEKKGQWLLQHEQVTEAKTTSNLMLFMALPERVNHWSEWNHVTVAARPGDKWKVIQTLQERPTESSAKKLIGELSPDKANPLLFSGSGNGKTLFVKMVMDFGYDPSAWNAITLLNLGRRLFPGSRLGNLESLYRRLNLPYYENPAPDALLASLTELADCIFSRLEEEGIHTIQQLQKFYGGEEYQVSFDRFAFDQDFIADLPSGPGVYIMRNRDGGIIYVGKAKNLRQRLSSYFAPEMNPDKKLIAIREQLYDLEIVETGSELEALLVEHRMISQEEPPINTQFAVHERTARQKNRFPQIVILPAAREQEFVLYLLSPETGLKELKIDGDSPGAPALEKAIEEHFFSDTAPINLADYELAMTWLSAHADHTNSIDMRRQTTARETVRLLVQQIKNLSHEFENIVQKA